MRGPLGGNGLRVGLCLRAPSPRQTGLGGVE
jgi:hypothetical protein